MKQHRRLYVKDQCPMDQNALNDGRFFLPSELIMQIASYLETHQKQGHLRLRGINRDFHAAIVKMHELHICRRCRVTCKDIVHFEGAQTRLPWMQSWRILTFNGAYPTSAAIELLLSSPKLATINSLSLVLPEISVGQCKQIVQGLHSSPNIGNLRSLSFADTDVQFPPILASSLFISKLHSLAFHKIALKDEFLEALCASWASSNLTSLILPNNDFSDAGILALAKSPFLKNLRNLKLSYHFIPFTRWKSEVLRELFFSPNFNNLRSLDLSFLCIEDAGIIHLSQSPVLHSLEILNCQHCHITSVGMEAIAASHALTNLTHLDVTGNSIQAATVAAMAQSPTLAMLRFLGVWTAHTKSPIPITEFIAALTSGPSLSHLQVLKCRLRHPDEEQMIRQIPKFAQTRIYSKQK